MPAKFNEGDRVRYDSKGENPAWDGAEGIVTSVGKYVIEMKLTTPVQTSSQRYSIGSIVGVTADFVSPLKPKEEAVEHPAHYGGKEDPYEVIKVAEAWGLDKDAYLFNVLKYVARAGKKDPSKELEDLEKGQFYYNRRVALLKEARA